MLFMNSYEIEDARAQYADHPVLGVATQQLVELHNWTQCNSDGWAYWPKPCRAAAKLQALIGGRREYLGDPERSDATVELYHKALTPIKAFRTRQGADFALFEVAS
jgi:hypothetical protein